VKEPHFPVFDEFRGASYTRRYEVFCRRLVRERHYTAAALLTSPSGRRGLAGDYAEPAEDLRFIDFARTLTAHATAFATERG
jgi:hypothetical protein